LKNNFFLAQNEEKQAAFHMAVENNNTEILEKNLSGPKACKLNPSTLKEALLAALYNR